MNRTLLVSLSLFALIAAAPQAASASEQISFTPGTRPFWGSFALGPAIGVSNSSSQLKLQQELGYHFFGASEGVAVALALQESFGNNVFVFDFLPKILYDIQLSDRLGIYLTPSAGFGFLVNSVSGGPFYNGSTDVGFDMQYGLELKAIIGNRGLVFFRPFTLDIGLVNGSVGVRYDLLFGGGATF